MRRFARNTFSLEKHFKATNVIQNRFVHRSSVLPRPCLSLEWEATKEAICYHVNYSQQKRSYAPTNSTKSRKCWNCKKEQTSAYILMQCQQCGFLQDLNADINYFELFEFPQKFDFDAQALKKRFRQLQTVVHPDKFSNKSSREQSNSADWSSLINKAYKILSIPLERGQYLLNLKGLEMPQDNSALDKEFLLDMMERNEEVADALTRNELNAINERLVEELKEKVNTLAETFSENNLEKCKTLLIEMKYLMSIQKTIKNRLQKLLGS